EDNIIKLEEELQAREEFVGAFAHELKTPLTSIIGYADMLRSRKLDEEKSFMSANYIYTEGKRLEAMSFRLLDIIVTKRGEVDLQMIPAELFFVYLRDMFGADATMTYRFRHEPAMVRAESNLIKTVLVNLVDNARKASEVGGVIVVEGYWTESGYCFAVRDRGVGIPEEEQMKITQAFYMVDKSRARSKNGAGLGLALCAEILRQHESRLKIASIPGESTTISFVLAAEEQETVG
ncbi:MAG: HAMP domain-containing histidine kinase, partial [Lachnospiraceae bacterium]|nr:HAMP domain-containing histidine kinase [Lachnospiraceae bacterium]